MVEIDGRVGWDAGATVGRAGLFELRGLRYDNRRRLTRRHTVIRAESDR